MAVQRNRWHGHRRRKFGIDWAENTRFPTWSVVTKTRPLSESVATNHLVIALNLGQNSITRVDLVGNYK